MKLLQSFETKRMTFRFLNMDDLEAVCRQFSDSDMCRYFDDPPCDLEEARGIIEHYQEPEGKGHLRYGMFDKTTGEFIGTCGYHYWDYENKQVEIGYDVWKDYWRQGYTTEALPALIDICFQCLGVECIYILTHPENKGSIATVKKFGFIECQPLRYVESEQKCMRLLRTEWFNKK